MHLARAAAPRSAAHLPVRSGAGRAVRPRSDAATAGALRPSQWFRPVSGAGTHCHTVILSAAGTYCHTVILSAAGTRCHTVTLSAAGTYCHCDTVSRRHSLSYCQPPALTVILSAAVTHWHTVILSAALRWSIGHFPRFFFVVL